MINILHNDFDNIIEVLKDSCVMLFQNKQEACMAFLKKVSEEQEAELDHLRALATKVQNSELDIKENKRRIQWMENCNTTLSNIV